VALFSVGPSVHRVAGKGIDKSLLGRWCWTLYRGKNNQLLKIYSAYCLNPPSSLFSVYAQHHQYFLSHSQDICPQQRFLDDLSHDLRESLNAGHNLIVLLDANDDMRNSNTSDTLSQLTL
jgi:hypothetical protein